MHIPADLCRRARTQRVVGVHYLGHGYLARGRGCLGVREVERVDDKRTRDYLDRRGLARVEHEVVVLKFGIESAALGADVHLYAVLADTRAFGAGGGQLRVCEEAVLDLAASGKQPREVFHVAVVRMVFGRAAGVKGEVRRRKAAVALYQVVRIIGIAQAVRQHPRVIDIPAAVEYLRVVLLSRVVALAVVAGRRDRIDAQRLLFDDDAVVSLAYLEQILARLCRRSLKVSGGVQLQSGRKLTLGHRLLEERVLVILKILSVFRVLPDAARRLVQQRHARSVVARYLDIQRLGRIAEVGAQILGQVSVYLVLRAERRCGEDHRVVRGQFV